MEPQDSDIDRMLTLRIDAQRVIAILRVEPDDDAEPMTQDQLVAYLDGQGIDDRCMLHDEIDQLLTSISKDPDKPHEQCVAKGKAAINSQGATIEFSPAIQTRIKEIAEHADACSSESPEDRPPTQPAADEEESINFHAQSPFLIVAKGQLIGKIIEESAGQDGYDVTGKVIESTHEEGNCEFCEETVKKDREGEITTRISGRLIYDDQKLEVHETLEIPTCVDFTTGNIDFPNDVIISEGVHDRFCVKAQGNIEIAKLVQASILISGGDIELKNGMAGRETGTITTGGDLKAKYLDGVHGCIGGLCEITKEITNCHLTIIGELKSPSAVLRGGEIRATKGGVLNTLGSEQGVETDIIVGWLPEIEEKMSVTLEFQNQLNTAVSKQTKELDMFLASIGKPSATQQEQIEVMEAEIKLTKEHTVSLSLAMARLTRIRKANTAHSFTVRSIIYAKTSLWLPGYRAYFDKDVRGELTIGLDEHNEPIITRGGTPVPLRTLAKLTADTRVLPPRKPVPTIEPALVDPAGIDDKGADSDGNMLKAA